MKKILLLLAILSMIPCIGYSQKLIQEKSISKYQLQQVLKDKISLDYYIRVNELNDSLAILQEEKIYSLQQEILEYKSIEQNNLIGIEYWKDKERIAVRKNKFIKFTSGIVIGSLVVLYIIK